MEVALVLRAHGFTSEEDTTKIILQDRSADICDVDFLRENIDMAVGSLGELVGGPVRLHKVIGLRHIARGEGFLQLFCNLGLGFVITQFFDTQAFLIDDVEHEDGRFCGQRTKDSPAFVFIPITVHHVDPAYSIRGGGREVGVLPPLFVPLREDFAVIGHRLRLKSLDFPVWERWVKRDHA